MCTLHGSLMGSWFDIYDSFLIARFDSLKIVHNFEVKIGRAHV